MTCITNGLSGLLFASFEMLRRLAGDGHQITYMAPASAKDAVLGEGMPFEELPDFETDAETAMSSLAARLKALEPDLVLIDTELPEAVLSSHAAGLNTVLLSTWMSIWKHPGLPPLHLPIQPGVGFLGSKLGMNLAWLWHLKTRRLMDALRQLRHGRRYRVAAMRAFAREIGFPHRKEFDFDNWLLPFSFRTLPILVLHAEAFEFPHTPRDHVHYVGPMVNPARAERPSDLDDQARIDESLARQEEGRSRLVFGGFGASVTADSALLETIFKAFAGRPDWELVVPLGDRKPAIEKLAPPANVHVVSWASQLTLLKRADAAIVHGGINTIDECIHFGTPMLAYSGGIIDMHGNVARIVHHGIGAEGDGHRDRPEVIAERLDRLISDPNVKAQLRKQRAAADRYIDERVLERTIDRFLNGDLGRSTKPLTSARAALPRAAASML
ncbi:MAG: glycosyltransferase [Geminicoccaceae bacterium]